MRKYRPSNGTKMMLKSDNRIECIEEEKLTSLCDRLGCCSPSDTNWVEKFREWLDIEQVYERY